MAALHRQLPGVQAIVSAPTPIVSFRTDVFGDQSKDPELGQDANLLSPFLLYVHKSGNNLGPAILRSQISEKGANLYFLYPAILHDRVAKVYLRP